MKKAKRIQRQEGLYCKKKKVNLNLPSFVFRFLLGIILIIATFELRQAASSAMSAEQTLDAFKLTDGCDALKDRLRCFQHKYRTIDGTCNNLCRIKQGAAFTPLRRFLPSEYAPGEQPRNESVTGHPLPNTRRVSVEIFQALNGDEFGIRPIFTHVTMTWGQFIDHDVTLTELTPNVECGNNTTPCVNQEGCIVISLHNLKKKERLEFNRSANCIPLKRSFRRNGEQVGYKGAVSENNIRG